MVSLSTAYGLCSLIDQSGFLHISDDENDCALVTLGRNIVIKYRVRLCQFLKKIWVNFLFPAFGSKAIKQLELDTSIYFKSCLRFGK